MSLETAVVGAGVVSDRHLAGLEKCPRTTLVAVCDREESRATDAADRYEIEPYADIDELIEGEDLDWLHLCTPVQTHLDLALCAIEAGIPVQIEKPVTETPEEFEKLATAAQRNEVPVSVVQNHLFLPVMRRAMAMVHAGKLGDIRAVTMHHTGSTDPDYAQRGSWAFDLPGGEFEEGLPHPIYVTLEAGGYPGSDSDFESTTSLNREYEKGFAYDNAQVCYRSESGTLCSVVMTTARVPQRRLFIDGTVGALTVDFVSDTLLTHNRNYTSSPITRALNNVDRMVGLASETARTALSFVQDRISDDWETLKRSDSHYYQIDEEAKALLGDGEIPVPLEHAKWTTLLIDAIRKDAAERTLPSSGANPPRSQ